MPNTTNFNFPTPADTDLVKDGASAIRSLGNSIDTTFVDLKGGTTGQVLSKASNSDMDFTWVAQDDSNAIQNALLTTTGDTIYASSASTPARLGIGSTGQVLTVSAGGVPTWATSSAGAYTEISTSTASSSASITFSSIPATYRNLYLVIRNFRPSNDGERLAMRFNSDSNTRYGRQGTAGTEATKTFSFTDIGVAQSVDNTITTNLVVITIWDYANTSTWKMCNFYGATSDQATPTSYYYYDGKGVYNQTAAISALSFAFDAGTITAGTFTLYGEK